MILINPENRRNHFRKHFEYGKWISLVMILISLPLLYGQDFSKLSIGAVVNDGGVSGGASWIDYDGDGDEDLFVANAQTSTNFLYRNEGNGSFVKITEGDIVTDENSTSGNSWADYDNDGDPDLFVSNQHNERNFLYRNEGDGSFTRLNENPIKDDRGTSYHCSWADYDNDGFLDLFVTNTDRVNYLYRNKGDGSFAKITGTNVAEDDFAALSGNWADYDNDGDPDLFVANYNGPNYLYRNDGNGQFSSITGDPVVIGLAYSMSSSWGDYDNDGDLDLFVGNAADGLSEGNNHLFRNNGNGSFKRITSGSIVNTAGTTWSATWSDYDNDGDLDLYVTNYNSGNVLYSNDGDDTFTEMSGSVLNETALSSGNAWCDYDKDGDSDLFVANWEEDNNFLYRNLGNSNHWINIQCVGTISNKSAIGTKVRIKADINGKSVWQMREITSNTGLRSQNSLHAEFGLGDAIIVDTVRIEWPSGNVDVVTQVASDGFYVYTETNTSVKQFNNKPLEPVLFPNYPNPFNPSTVLMFSVSENSLVSLEVYNVKGQKVNTIFNKICEAGLYHVLWDGTDSMGNTMANGFYLFHLVTKRFRVIQKGLLIK